MPPRPYRQVARAHAVQDTEQQIVDALRTLLERRWFDEITLDDIAAAAGTTRQTVIRRFGTKVGILSALATTLDVSIREQRWSRPAGTVSDIIAILMTDYEKNGDIIIRNLSQEQRIPEFTALLDLGRKGHREWIEEMFAAWLDKLGPDSRVDRLAQLLAITDVWTWHLLRRDQKHPADKTHRLMAEAVERLLREEQSH